MAPVTQLVSVEEYLAHETKPASEYLDGVVTQKPLPTDNHSTLQGQLCLMILQSAPAYKAGPELTVQIRPGKYLVPDVAVQRRDRRQSPYPTEPIPLCIEILSPGDRMSEVISKCEEYHQWGVEHTWILDPEAKVAWSYPRGARLQEIPAGADLVAGEIRINTAELFAVV